MRFCHFASWNMPQHQFCHLCSWNYQVLSLAILLLLVKRSISSQVFYGEIPMWIFSLFSWLSNRTCTCDDDSSSSVQFVPPENSRETDNVFVRVSPGMNDWFGWGQKAHWELCLKLSDLYEFIHNTLEFPHEESFFGRKLAHFFNEECMRLFQTPSEQTHKVLLNSLWPREEKIGQFPRRYLFLMRLSLKTLMS